MQFTKDIRLDALMIHFKVKHKDAFLAEGRSLLDMGFVLRLPSKLENKAKLLLTYLKQTWLTLSHPKDIKHSEP